MKLTPLDIKKQEFKSSFRGYDPMEVETFLEMVANEYEEFVNENKKLKDEILTLKTQLQDFQKMEHTLKQTLMNAQESVNRARINTEKEANLIIHEAELKAEKILEKSRRDLETMKNELVVIRAQKESFAKRLKHLLQSQIELIKVLEIDDSDYGEKQTKLVGDKEPDEKIEVRTDTKEKPGKKPEFTEKVGKKSPDVEPEHKSGLEKPDKIDLFRASSVSEQSEGKSKHEAATFDKLEEFLQKKEAEDQYNSPPESEQEKHEKPATLNDILKEYEKDRKNRSNDDMTSEPMDDFLKNHAEKPQPKIDETTEDQQDLNQDKKEESSNQKSVEQEDLFKKANEGKNKKRNDTDDDQMVF